MNATILCTGACILMLLGVTIGEELSPLAAVGLGLLWLGLSVI